MGSGGSKTHEAFSIAPAGQVSEEVGPGAPAVGGQNLLTDPAPADSITTAAAAGLASLSPEFTEGHDKLLAAMAARAQEPRQPLAADEPVESGAGAEAVEETGQWSGQDILTPIPDELQIGDGIGVAVAVGGADLVDGAALLVAYKDPDKDTSHEVLRVTLTPEAEDKLLDALNPPDAPKIPIQVPQTVHGRLPYDTENNLNEELVTAAKSINSHLKDGTEIPEKTHARLQDIAGKLDQLQAAGVEPGSGEEKMLDHYRKALEECRQRCADDYNTPYTSGGKIPTITAFEHEGQVMVTQMVPDPNFHGGGFPVTERPMSRVSAKYEDGQSMWDGSSRTKASGKELAVDLGDGYQAVVRPRSMNVDGKCVTSLQGTVEIIAPPGAGHQHQLLDKLGDLNVVNRPMSGAEAEWTYLQRNIASLDLDKNPAIAAARTATAGIEDAHLQQLLHQRARDAIGLDDAGMTAFARKLQLDAEADALPSKVRIVRHAVAQALGHSDGAAMAASQSYNPVPHRARGWLTWQRIGQTPKDLATVFKGQSLIHGTSSGGGGISAILRSGVLASTEKRRQMGIQSSIGTSEEADQQTGGSSSVFLRIKDKAAAPQHVDTGLVWDDPGRILSQTGWYAYDSDCYGATHGPNVHHQTRNPKEVSKFTSGSNEIMIPHGLDLLGAHAPDKVICKASQRPQLLKELAAAGITVIGGKPIEKVVIAA